METTLNGRGRPFRSTVVGRNVREMDSKSGKSSLFGLGRVHAGTTASLPLEQIRRRWRAGHSGVGCLAAERQNVNPGKELNFHAICLNFLFIRNNLGDIIRSGWLKPAKGRGK